MEKLVYATMLKLVLGDITKVSVDAVINDASSDLKPSRGPNKAIHDAAGPALLTECARAINHQGPIPEGECCVTDGGLLRAKYVIHAVGPKWRGGQADEDRILANTYQNALKVAVDHAIKTVAITPLAIGDHAKYPIEKSALIAVSSIEEFCRAEESLKEIQFVIADPFTHSVFKKAFLY